MCSLPPHYSHQKKELQENKPRWGKWWECGTSKTRTAIDLAEENGIKEALVVVPPNLVFNFEKEVRKWSKGITKFHIYKIYDFKKMYKELSKYDCLIIDEAHNFSGMTGFRQKSAALKCMLDYVKRTKPKYIWPITATPYLSTPFNAYALAEVLGHKMNYQAFKKKFFNEYRLPGMRYPIVKAKPKDEIKEDIAEFLNKIGSTVKMADVFDVPEQIFQEEYFNLTAEQKKGIRELEDTVPISYWTKCHQIMGGTLKGNEYEESKVFKSEKQARIIELCSEHKKIAIVCRYNYEIKVLSEKLKGKNIHIINGAVPTKDRAQNVEKVETEEECIILVNAACSEGYELPSIPIMVFYSYDFSLKNYIQMIGRILRSNRLKKNVYISLIIKDSVDEDVYKCVMDKTDFDCEIYNKNK